MALSRSPEGRGDIRLRKQLVNLFCRKVLGQRLIKLGRLDIRGGIRRQAALPHQKPEQVAQGDQMPGHRTGTQIPIIELLEKGANVVAINRRRGFSQAVKKIREFREVAAITLDAVGRQPFLNTRKVKKQLNFLDERGVGEARDGSGRLPGRSRGGPRHVSGSLSVQALGGGGRDSAC